MKMPEPYLRLNPSHPGETVKDIIEDLDWTIKYAANQLDISVSTLSRIINGRTGISLKTALALESLGWSNAAFWLRHQTSYELAMARKKKEG